jgi:putative ABC transport system permease protein
MLGRVLALNLEKEVGESVDIAGELFQVVGIYESDSLFENGGIIVPLPELQRMIGRQGYVSGYVIEADEPEPEKIQALAHKIESQFAGVAAVPARDFVQSDIQIRLVKSMAWATSIIAMILGSVGVLNTMLMTVFERTGEIGILRALGWRRPRVLNLILSEAVAVGAIGSVIGIGLGVLGVKALALSPTSSVFIAPDLSPAVLAFGLVLGIGLSLLGGLYPGLRAAALNPMEALRHE